MNCRNFLLMAVTPLCASAGTDYVRIAMLLPQKTASDFPPTVNVGCYPVSNDASGACQNIRVIKLVRLDRNYLPVIEKIGAPPQNVKAGEKAVFVSGNRKNRN